MDTTVPVLLLKIGSYVLHHGAVDIARSLGRLGVPVYAIVEDRYAPLAVCRHLTGAFIDRTKDTNELLTFTAAIGESINRPTVLLPTDDDSAIFIAEHAKILSRWFLFPHLPAGLPRLLTDKMSLPALCRKAGISCAEHALPTSIDQVHAFIERATFPVVVKPAEHSRRLNNGKSSFIAHSPAVLLALCGPAEGFRCPNIILQEYIPGEDWVFHGYCNPETGCFWWQSLAGKRELAWWSWDDPLPFFMMATRLSLRTARRAVRTMSEQIQALLHFGRKHRTLCRAAENT
jgi:D-aspartate ligase